MASGLLLTLAETRTLALLIPVVAGVKVTVMVQLAPAATEDPQVLDCVKSPGLVPLVAMLLMFSVPVPIFESVKVWGELLVPTFWLPNAK
jgi:hypothetical protein